ncbi:MAG: RNA polymerase sigma factor [Desulfosarcinaceae bacterium]|nr:RNA polymerase sigma factor [Desulfosarcinaceae bacterium]
MNPIDAADQLPRDADETDLIRAAQAGSREAFHRLVDRHQAALFRLVIVRTRSRMDAEDIVQDVFFKAYAKLDRLKRNAAFRSWLYQIALNKIRDYYRRRKVRAIFGSLEEIPEYDLPESAQSPAGGYRQMARKAFWQEFYQMLNLLAKMEREVFLLRFFDELSIKEISRTLGKGESTIKTHLYRALRKVRERADRFDLKMEV